VLAVGATALAVGALAALTWLALEGREVAVLRTRGDAGAVRETRVWVADEAGVPWIEAGNPERAFYADLARDPHVDLVRGGAAARYVARPLPGEEGHRKIRGMLRAKYGLADWWIGCLVDTSRSVAIRLDRAPATG